MKTQKISTKEKASFYISKDLVKRMKPFLVKTKKTDFINESIEKNITELEKEKAKKEFIDFLHSTKRAKRKTTALETLHEIRKQRENKLLGKSYKDVKHYD